MTFKYLVYSHHPLAQGQQDFPHAGFHIRSEAEAYIKFRSHNRSVSTWYEKDDVEYHLLVEQRELSRIFVDTEERI